MSFHPSLPTDPAAFTSQAHVRLMPENVSGQLRNLHQNETSPGNKSLNAAYQIADKPARVTGYVSPDIAYVLPALAAEGAALVAALCARAGERVA